MSNGEIKPNPDPTVATNEAVERAATAERDYVDGQVAVLQERLAGIDRATKLLSESHNASPEDVVKEVTHLRELSAEMFQSVSQQFRERDIRSEREARDNKVAVDAAFAAQKESAAAQDAGNQKAIDKSEKTTLDRIAVQGGLIDDLKARVGTIEASGQGGRAQAKESRSAAAAIWQAAGVIVAVLALFAVVLISTRPV